MEQKRDGGEAEQECSEPAEGDQRFDGLTDRAHTGAQGNIGRHPTELIAGQRAAAPAYGEAAAVDCCNLHQNEGAAHWCAMGKTANHGRREERTGNTAGAEPSGRPAEGRKPVREIENMKWVHADTR